MRHLPFLLLLVASYAVAAPQNNVCVPRATGVPTREGPPKWLNWTNTGTIPADENLDDPRWVGSTAHTFALGSAKAPLQARALISTQGAAAPVRKFLFLSVIVDLDGYNAGSNVTPRDLFIGFHRPSPPAGASDHGYILQFHLSGMGGGAPSGMQAAPVACDDYSTCDEDASTTPHDYWRVFADRGNSAPSGCSGTSVSGRQYDPVPSANVHWITNTTPAGQDGVRYWKIAASDPSPFAQNRWAVQVRIPIVDAAPAAAAAIADGIEDGSSFFYEATARLTDPMNNGPFATVGWFPPTMTKSICPNTGSNILISEEMSDAGGSCPGCNPLLFSVLSDQGVPLPPGAPACDGGLDIDYDHIGVIFNAAIPPIETITSLGKEFFARDLTTTNHVIALPFNNKPIPAGGGGANTMHSRIQARFRLAEWGAAPWSVPGDIGKWADIRGAENGICGTPPTPPAICGVTDIEAQKHGLVTFDWTIGGDTAGIGSSEYCQFGLHPPAASGETCSAVGVGCPAGQVRSSKAGGGFWPCVPSIYQHDQCMLVELSSPDGSATFVRNSIWSNMRFGQMSTLAHDALIDARALPTIKGQKVQDIYLVAVPRNMPRTVGPNKTTVSLAQNAAVNAALKVARPYLEDLDRAPPNDLVERLSARAQPVAAAVRLPENDERVQQILRARRIMPPEDARRVDGLLRVAFTEPSSKDKTPSATLTHDTVSTVGSSTAADIVPTLEIYPYYAPFGKGRAYQPMTSFSLFLSHEETLGGFNYEIDGAEKVGANIYHLQIPVGFAKRIQVRAQAVASSEPALARGNPRWPCSTCCGTGRCGLVAGLGNTVPGLLAGVFVLGRRRRRRDAQQAAKQAE